MSQTFTFNCINENDAELVIKVSQKHLNLLQSLHAPALGLSGGVAPWSHGSDVELLLSCCDHHTGVSSCSLINAPLPPLPCPQDSDVGRDDTIGTSRISFAKVSLPR